VIRTATSDAALQAYADVWSAVHTDAPLPGDEVGRRAATLDDARRYFLAEVEGQAVGTGFASRTSTPGWAATLVAVLQAHRRRGVGSALLEASLDHARDLGPGTHRRRGIARALKQAQIAWAAERGFRRLLTDTAWANEATRRLNESLGYRPLPPVFAVRKQLA
jgi:GNAT superfamily N-acetyltransferase